MVDTFEAILGQEGVVEVPSIAADHNFLESKEPDDSLLKSCQQRPKVLNAQDSSKL